MGRSFKSVAVVKAYDAGGQLVDEEIVPADAFGNSGSLLLNVAPARAAKGVRFISLRLFDDAGKRLEDRRINYGLDGQEVKANYRRPDGSIIENVDWV